MHTRPFSFFVFILLLCFSLICSSCQNKSKIRGKKGRLILTSSTEFLSLAESLSYGFREKSDLILIVKGSLGQEKKILESGLSDLLLTSSKTICKEETEIKCLLIGADQLVLIVNSENPENKISQEQLLEIFSGQNESWQVISRGSSSALKASFDKYFFNEQHVFNPRSVIVNSNNETKIAVSRLKNSIGYISIGSLALGKEEQTLKIKQIEVYSKLAKLIKPPKQQIKVAYLKTNQKKVEKFILFLKSDQLSKELIKESGYLVL